MPASPNRNLRPFELPAETLFATDIHYTTAPADLERLFDDLP